MGSVISKYHEEWSALPSDGRAIESIEMVESTVDEFAESKSFDNDDYDDVGMLFGEECAPEIEAVLDGD